MFDYFIGTVKDIGENTVVLECNGIGFEFIASKFCLLNLKLNESAKLYAQLCVREDAVNLIGFYSKQEKAMFSRLNTVNGIGAKGAIAILSGLSLNELCAAIASGNVKSLSTIKGIGKKTAERIVLELREKLTDEYNDVLPGEFVKTDINEDAVLALIALGYSKQEAVNAVKRIDTANKTVEEIVVAALKRG